MHRVHRLEPSGVGELCGNSTRLTLAGWAVRVVPSVASQPVTELVCDRGRELTFVANETCESCVQREHATRQHVESELVLVESDDAPRVAGVRSGDEESIEDAAGVVFGHRLLRARGLRGSVRAADDESEKRKLRSHPPTSSPERVQGVDRLSGARRRGGRCLAPSFDHLCSARSRTSVPTELPSVSAAGSSSGYSFESGYFEQRLAPALLLIKIRRSVEDVVS
jgi:hypothetical protein